MLRPILFRHFISRTMKRISLAYLTLTLLVISACGTPADLQQTALQETIDSMVLKYEKPVDSELTDEEWQEEAVYRAKRTLATSADTDPELLVALAEDSHPNMPRYVAKNASTPDETLEALAVSEDYITRTYAAANVGIPLELLDALSRDEHDDVRGAAAYNPSNSEENMKLFVTDSNNNVQQQLARNKSLTSDVMMLMAEQSSVVALDVLIKRSDIPQEVVDVLKNNPNTTIAAKAEAYGQASE